VTEIYTATMYSIATGAIVGSISGSGPDAVGVPDEFSLIPGIYDGAEYWVDGGEAVARLTMAVAVSADTIAADGVAECVLSGLPDPCTVTVRGAVTAGPVEVTGGSLTITSTALGAISVSINADPVWKPWGGVINAA
jgi:hypothetical protein